MEDQNIHSTAAGMLRKILKTPQQTPPIEEVKPAEATPAEPIIN